MQVSLATNHVFSIQLLIIMAIFITVSTCTCELACWLPTLTKTLLMSIKMWKTNNDATKKNIAKRKENSLKRIRP